MTGDQVIRPTKYQSIHEIPDSMVSTYAKRDPDNPYYKTRRWVNFKKQQILYSQQDGKPVYMRTPFTRFMYRSLWVVSVGSLITNIYVFNQQLNKKKN